MKLYKIAHQIPPSVMFPSALVMTVKTQLHRLLPRVHDRMVALYTSRENDLDDWLESMVNLPNQGYDLGDAQRPSPIEIIDVEKPREAEKNLALPAAIPPVQSIFPVQYSGQCRRCLKNGHWAANCPAPAPARRAETSDRHFAPRHSNSMAKAENFGNSNRHRNIPFRRRGKHQRPQYGRRHYHAYYVNDASSTDSDSDHDDRRDVEELEEIYAHPDKYSRAFDEQVKYADSQGSNDDDEKAVSHSTESTVLSVQISDEFSPTSAGVQRRDGNSPPPLVSRYHARSLS